MPERAFLLKGTIDDVLEGVRGQDDSDEKDSDEENSDEKGSEESDEDGNGEE